MSENTTPRPRGEQLQAHILQTALQLFSERGYFNTSVQDIRKQADVSTGAIYHHFKNKEDLAKSLYLSLLHRMQDEIQQIMLQHADCQSRHRQIVRWLFVLATEEPQTMQFILAAKHQEYLPDEPPICSSRPFTLMRQVAEDGMAQGELRQMEAWVAASAMFAGALRLAVLHLDGGLDKSLLHYLDETVDCAWRAVTV